MLLILLFWFLDLLHLLVVCWPSLCYWIRVSQAYLTVAITWGFATNLDFLVPSKLTESYYPGVDLGIRIFKTYLRGAFELLFFLKELGAYFHCFYLMDPFLCKLQFCSIQESFLCYVSIITATFAFLCILRYVCYSFVDCILSFVSKLSPFSHFECFHF